MNEEINNENQGNQEVVQETEQVDSMQTDVQPDTGKKNHLQIIVALVIVILMVLVFVFLAKLNSNTTPTPTPAEEVTAQPEARVPTEQEVIDSKLAFLDSSVLTTVELEYVGTFFASAENNMTLYVKRDGIDCEDLCLTGMTPYEAPGPHTTPAGATQNYITVELNEKTGLYQYGWDGRPLYYYAEDRKPGDVIGDGYRNAFKLARPI